MPKTLLILLLTGTGCRNSIPIPDKPAQHIFGTWHSQPSRLGKMTLVIAAKDSSYTESFDDYTFKTSFWIINDSVIAIRDKSNSYNYRVVVFDPEGNFYFKPAKNKLREDIELSYEFTFKKSNL